MNGIQEVSGSIPLISTNSKEQKNLENHVFSRFFLIFSQICRLNTLLQNNKKRTEKRTKQRNREKTIDTPKKGCIKWQTTVTFYKNMKKQVVEYFDGKVLQEISPLYIQRFFDFR